MSKLSHIIIHLANGEVADFFSNAPVELTLINFDCKEQFDPSQGIYQLRRNIPRATLTEARVKKCAVKPKPRLVAQTLTRIQKQKEKYS